MSSTHEPYSYSAQSDPAAIERDIEATRAELNRTLNALQARLSPRQRLSEVIDSASTNGSELLDRVVTTARRNPAPFVFVGLSLAFMLINGTRRRRD
jgi:hypothetical protein